MDSPQSAAARTAPETGFPQAKRISELAVEGSRVSGRCADGEPFALPRLVGSHLRRGDELLVAGQTQPDATSAEVLIRKPDLKHGDVYTRESVTQLNQSPTGAVNCLFQCRWPAANSGFVPSTSHATRSGINFFSADRRRSWQYQQPLYRLFRVPVDVTFGELRVAYRLQRMELKQAKASATDVATLERAYNLLADPQLRAIYDQLRMQPDAPVPFPYSGFGSLLAQGERAKEGDVLFAQRILAFLPERHRHKLTFPLRKIDFFSDYAILRDRKRKLEVLIRGNSSLRPATRDGSVPKLRSRRTCLPD